MVDHQSAMHVFGAIFCLQCPSCVASCACLGSEVVGIGTAYDSVH